MIDEKGNTRKCPECKIKDRVLCICQGTGKATISIPKEWVECPNIPAELSYHINCRICNGKGKIPKYKVGDEIEEFICQHLVSEDAGLEYQHYCQDSIKLKIISETEDKWRVVSK
ncbi:MAG: hypothetical protein AABY22_17265 [Nanoarchaeota archaeon]